METFDKSLIYYFVGIKGTGMSALALVLDGEGYQVQGSDVATYFFTQQELDRRQIPIYEFSADNLKEGMFVIAGNAFPDDHPEIQRARELGLPLMRYHNFLGKLIENYTSIAITGSHGKTSTTGLMAHILSKLAPTSYLIGDGTGSGDEAATYFALEACEYRRHFLAYVPDYAIITNVDFDHPDYYQSIQDVFEAIQTFVHQAKKAIIACGEDDYLRQLEAEVPVYYYGFATDNEVYAANIERTTEGSSFDVYIHGEKFGRFDSPVYGKHNILNVLAVITVAYLEGFPADKIAEELASYGGVKRRFSTRELNQLTLIDDYAHHPSEIKATIDAAHQKYPDREIIAVFQPHTFSRTVALLNEFANALSVADQVYLVDIFTSAREKEGDISIEDLANLVVGGAEIISKDYLTPLMDYQDAVILFMGAGDIDKLSRQFEQVYSQQVANKF